MNRISIFGAAALLAVLPTAVHAQSTPAATSSSQEVIVEKTTTVVVKESPKPSPITFTPYGFFLANAFFSDSPSARNYPTPVIPCTGIAQCGGTFLLDVRQTRLGTRLVFDDKAGWTGATLTGLVEVDFNGGYGVGATSAAGSTLTAGNSSAFYSPVIRLRKAYADAAWGSEAKFTLRIGQDDRLVSPLRPVSLAYVANPLFQFAGLLHGRAPMAALRFDLAPKNGIAVSVAVAALDPMDNTQLGSAANAFPAGTPLPIAVDFGAGNRSQMPNFEGRVGVGFRLDGKKIVELGGWAGWQNNRFIDPATGKAFDQSTDILGGDLTLNIWYVQGLASIYKANGYDVPGSLTSQGIGLKTTGSILVTPSTLALVGTKAMPAFGGWFQIAVGPPSLFQVYGGWGGTQTLARELIGYQNVASATRPVQSYMWAIGAIGYAGKNWRFSAEYAVDRTWTYSWNQEYKVGQFSVNSQVVF
jgi:hypothetical protein